ncbi:MAG: nicotinate-nucleotide adenylyltransferase [Rhodospirillaceae bacterium]|nr:nicotinate-nucleotide adenylyltransferase [Rhodospirillaceae bacterium]MBL6930077.1 nicotinate-nucleotide adenylyltransferase [Rhodospirillales bacterium]
MPPVTTPQRIGLLGGSFNPAHEGHLHISTLALERLKLDQVWWLVSPQNPLKPVAGMASFADRFKRARKIAAVDQRIVVSDFEEKASSRYTVDTIAALKAQFPGVSFVWVMGADLLVQMPHWKRWRQLFRTLPIAIFARPAYSSRALTGRAARRFKGSRIARFRARSLVDMKAPAWAFLRTRLNAQSATRIRAKAGRGGKD